MCAKRCVERCSFCSICATDWPVSTAVELATDRNKAFRLGCLRLGSVVLSIGLVGVVSEWILTKRKGGVAVPPFAFVG